jgi:hypothetical protein
MLPGLPSLCLEVAKVVNIINFTNFHPTRIAAAKQKMLPHKLSGGDNDLGVGC